MARLGWKRGGQWNLGDVRKGAWVAGALNCWSEILLDIATEYWSVKTCRSLKLLPILFTPTNHIGRKRFLTTYIGRELLIVYHVMVPDQLR